jgi:SAM-dependent methyltransferase
MSRRTPSYEEGWEVQYSRGRTPFDLEAPLPWVVTLAEKGRIRGRVLDAGCGGGHNALYLAGLGYDVVGIDVAPSAISRARHKAEQQGVHAEFAVGDIVNLADWPGMFDTVIDIGCFHSLYPADRARYASTLRAACRQGTLLHLRCFTDRKEKEFAGAGTAAGLSASDLEQSFADGWDIEDLTAVEHDVIPERGSWSGSWSTGRSEGMPDDRNRHQETWPGDGPKRAPSMRPIQGTQVFASEPNMAEFWYATMARRP